MAVTIFDQFISPLYYGIPLMALAILLPWTIFPLPTIRWYSNRFLSIQNWLIRKTTKQLIFPLNKPAHKWALMFTSLIIYIITLNMLGLLPYTFTPTTQLSFNLGLAVPLWLTTVIIGLRNQPMHSLAHLVPEGAPITLVPALVIIETISLMIRPLALGIRLTANLTAGHLLMQLVSLATLALLSLVPPLAIFSSTLLLFLTILEIAVAMIQAYVFVLLLTLYLQENV